MIHRYYLYRELYLQGVSLAGIAAKETLSHPEQDSGALSSLLIWITK